MPKTFQDWLQLGLTILIVNAALNTIARRFPPVGQILQGF